MIPILDFMFNIIDMNIGIQKLLLYAHCMIQQRKSVATNTDL